ncbi:DUF1906 domain-containing protein [Streptomyces sp. RB6PN25]|uniref:DUF1906 domain-containing protein n=2 Tax=Streptomyces humicola TaxID=2953240 RepID=A0ABT1Q6R7_9ACTN|nr:DUF1906 domain-containing protein [Streptomyces humicola]
MAAATCLATGATSAAATARPSDTGPQGSSGASNTARDDDMSSFDPLGSLSVLTSLGDGSSDDLLSQLPVYGLQDQVPATPDDRALEDTPSDTPDDTPSDTPDDTPSDTPGDMPSDTPAAPAATVPQALPATLPGDAPTTGDLSTVGAHLYKGWGFDACTAPSLSTMRAWRHSYGAIGVYIGGRSRNCAQPRLSREWVRAVNDMGWKILPIFVGSQSPCTTNHVKRRYPIDVDDPKGQGMDEGDDAVRDAARLGIAPRSPIFLDMESYRTRSRHCTRPVIAFTQAWSRALREQGYVPGFYSSADTGITQIELARREGMRNLPDLMWFAHWRVDPTIYGESRIARAAWRPHRRIHQFDGDVTERHHGRRITIDRDYIDSPVAIVE